MKKALSLILVSTLALSTTAAASDKTMTKDKTKAEVTATYVAGVDGGTIYGVDISWGSMIFTYTDVSKGTWNADEHRYTNGKPASWSYEEGANVISVTNHSNAPIKVTPSYVPISDCTKSLARRLAKDTIKILLFS